MLTHALQNKSPSLHLVGSVIYRKHQPLYARLFKLTPPEREVLYYYKSRRILKTCSHCIAVLANVSDMHIEHTCNRDEVDDKPWTGQTICLQVSADLSH